MNASDILNRITEHRRRQRDFVRWLLTKNDLLGQKVRGCGSFLHLREWLQHDQSRLINANFCKKHLLCPTCAWRRATKLVARYTKKAEILAKAHPELIPCMITFGPRNGEDLAVQLELLKDILKRMGATARKAASKTGVMGGHSLIEWNKIAGSLTALEVTNKGKGWHVHCHTFALLSAYIDREALSGELGRFSGGSCTIVDVRACKNGIIAGMCEVVKYALKPGELTHEQTLFVFEQFKGTRMINARGLLRGDQEGDIDEDDLPDLDGPTRDMIACWLWSSEKFHLRELPPEDVLSREEEARLSCQIAANQI